VKALKAHRKSDNCSGRLHNNSTVQRDALRAKLALKNAVGSMTVFKPGNSISVSTLGRQGRAAVAALAISSRTLSRTELDGLHIVRALNGQVIVRRFSVRYWCHDREHEEWNVRLRHMRQAAPLGKQSNCKGKDLIPDFH
jgi:hypothetical protein